MKRTRGGDNGDMTDVKQQLQQVSASLQDIAERLTANKPILETMQQSVEDMNMKMNEINQNCVAAQEATSTTAEQEVPTEVPQQTEVVPQEELVPPAPPTDAQQPPVVGETTEVAPSTQEADVATSSEVKHTDEDVLKEIDESAEMTEEEKQQYKRYFTSGDEMYNPEEGTKQLEEFFKRKAAIQQLGGYLNLQDMTDYSGLFFTLICFVISLVVIERVVIPSKYSMYEYSIPIFFAITYTSLLGIITIAGGIDRNMFMTHITSMIIILVLMFLLWKHKCTPNYGVALLFAWLVSLWWSVMIASIR